MITEQDFTENYSDEKILERWDNMGFLEDINEDLKLNLAKQYEKTALYLLEHHNKETNVVQNCIEMLSFPIVRIVCMHDPTHQFDISKIYEMIHNKKITQVGLTEYTKDLHNVCGDCSITHFIEHYLYENDGNYLKKMLNIEDCEAYFTHMLACDYIKKYIK